MRRFFDRCKFLLLTLMFMFATGFSSLGAVAFADTAQFVPWTGQGTTTGNLNNIDCSGNTSNPGTLLWVLSLGGGTEEVTAATLTLSMNGQVIGTYPMNKTGHEMKAVTPYTTLTGLSASAEYVGTLGNGASNLVISHGCPAPTSATPAAVTFNEACGTANDYYTIPTTVGVNYQVGGVTQTAGNHSATGAVTVTAVAQTGYVLTGTTTWSHTFSSVACDQEATPAAVTFNEACGTANDYYTIPTTVGVNYQVGGVTQTAGNHSATGAVTVTAVAQTGYVLTGTTTWSHTFTNEDCPKTPVPIPAQPSVKDDCGANNAMWNVPSDTTSLDWTLEQNGHLTVQTKAGYIFSDGTSFKDFGVAPDSGEQCDKKVFVCKYVGTPGVNERLQTGQNPISVSVHAIEQNGWNGQIPGYFSDAQGRSYVLEYDTGQATPDVSRCPGHAPDEVTPTAVVFTDVCSTNNDRYTIPAQTGVVYKVNGNVVTAGTYPATGTVTVTAEAATGYVLTGTTTWSHTFTNVPCGPVNVPVTPGSVVVTQPNCEDAFGYITVPATTGVVYMIDGVAKSAATYKYPAGTTITVSYAAAPGYVLTGDHASVQYMFLAANDCVLGETDVCPNLADSQATVPEGMTKDVNGNCVTPTGGQGGVVLSETTTAPTEEVLADTGNSTVLPTILAALLPVIAAVSYLAPRRKYNQ